MSKESINQRSSHEVTLEELQRSAAQSTDPNPAENLWAELRRREHQTGTSTLDDLEGLCRRMVKDHLVYML
ncbi:hypothetical protein AMECASPLE_014308 [Ameca splendens]|uniref:Uncharacterized protein n=1 Tax=Ameca splendens TaxID=208324 RepID=A0ABV0XEN6_9TELE